ncbi:MAG: DUF5104 domain-containing protein [Oscillospiraceae bacterium]|nr:DUF5104 domain-containing protein [Oscillospiraceae bacterium]
MNKKMILLFAMILIIFSGCKSNESKSETYTDSLKRISIEIVRCFDEKDIEGLCNLMSQSSKDKYYIDTQIKEAFEFYEGKSTKAVPTGFQREGLMNDFVDVTRYYDPAIHVISDTGKEYRICFRYYYVDTDNPDNVGLTFIKLMEFNTGDLNYMLAYIGGDIENIYRDMEMPFTRNPEYTNAVKEN